MKNSILRILCAISIAGVASNFVMADTQTTDWALNAPVVGAGGNSVIHWGRIVSQSSIQGSNKNVHSPQKWAGTSINADGQTYCQSINSGPFQSSELDPEIHCNWPVQQAPQINFLDFKAIAQLENGSCNNGPCLNPNTSGSFVDTSCTVGGLPKVWYFTGDASFASSHFFCGVLVSEGKVTFRGNDGWTGPVQAPSDAWKQYEAMDTPNPGEYPGDSGLNSSNNPVTLSLSFNGYIYATTGYDGGGGSNILGSIQFGQGASSNGGGSNIYFSSQTIFITPPSGQVNEPIIFPNGGCFGLNSSVSVQMVDTTPNSVIYYTTDGSVPDSTHSNAIQYQGAFNVTANATLIAKAYAANMIASTPTNPAVFTFSSQCGGNTPPTITFSAFPASIISGQSSTLTWGTQNATSVSIDQGVGSNLSLSGNTSVSPLATTIYTLTATGPGGTRTAQVTVTVGSTPPPSCGDGQCNGTETCSSCPQDCGVCPPVAQLDFSPASYSYNEAAGLATITVARSVDTSGTSTVQFATSNGTAIAGQDYLGVSGTLTFAPGDTTKTFDVPLIDDSLVEPNETVFLTLSNASGATLGTSQATLTILDNDTTNPPPPPPAPFISELVPYTAPVGFASNFQMRILGSNFASDAQVHWNFNSVDSVFPSPVVVSSSEIDVTVLPAQVSQAGSALVSVVNVSAALTSNQSPFDIRSPGDGNPPPFIKSGPTANPNPTYTKTTTLTAVGGTLTPGAGLTYTWMLSGTNPATGVTFSNNGSAAGTSSVGTFPMAGTYHIFVRVTDTVTNFSVDSPSIDVVVIRNATSITVTPKNQTITINMPLNLTASIVDQWGVAMTLTPSWSSTAGSLAPSGLSASFSASDASIQQAVVTAAVTNALNVPLSDTAKITIILAGAGAGDISNAKAYPVPFKGNSGDPGITFSGLVPGARIRLFTITGHIVQTLEAPASCSGIGCNVLWDIKNANLNRVASGVYLYIIEAGGQKKQGKLVVIE